MSNPTVQFLNYIATYNEGRITVSHTEVGTLASIRPLAFYREGGERIGIKELIYRKTDVKSRCLTAVFSNEAVTVHLHLAPTFRGVLLSATDHEGKPLSIELCGTVGTADDPENDAFATVIDRVGEGLRAAVGPAVGVGDNAILDRKRGVATVLSETGDGVCPPSLSLSFDFAAGAYTFTYTGTSLHVALKERLFEEMFGIRYRAINKNSTFKTPPAGWMTWYAVKFGASEESVLRNAEFMRKHLYDYGANVLWVDWEWQNTALTIDGPPEVDFFHPVADRYPHGMGYVAERLSALDLIPALWVGFTHEQGECEFVRRHPETVLSDKVYWCGRYLFDPSHPTWQREYLLPAARAVLDWGYKALKWDCLPITLTASDIHYSKMYDKTGGSAGALRKAVGLVRETVGEDFFMLSCSGEERTVRFAADIFDAARVGEDVFHFASFADTVEKLSRLYPLHNTVLYCDPDNLIVRESVEAVTNTEGNSIDEARSRAALVSLLGLPITLGDDLPTLSEERLDLCRRVLPTLDAHPRDIRDYAPGETFSINLAVARPFGTWNVVGLFNLSNEERTMTLSLRDGLQLKAGSYHLYDFFADEYLGTTDTAITVTLAAHACRVLRLTPVTDAPTVVATSRHISMGVPDLLALSVEGRRLCGRSAVVAGDDYTVAVYDPESGKVEKHTIPHEKTGETDWEIAL